MSSSQDFSLFSLFTAGLACFVGVANAYTQPVGPVPIGNPIYHPGLNEIVPVGKPYAITWTPTTSGTVTLVLLKGPASNILPVGPIVEMINNTGTYEWTPSASLAPGTTGYGIQLIVDANGQYQYTTQFGISNPNYVPDSSNSSTASVPTSGSQTVPTSAYTTSQYVLPTNGSSYPVSRNTTIVAPTISTTIRTTSTVVTSTSASTTSATSNPTPNTGGAEGLAASFAGLVVAAGVAVFAL